MPNVTQPAPKGKTEPNKQSTFATDFGSTIMDDTIVTMDSSTALMGDPQTALEVAGANVKQSAGEGDVRQAAPRGKIGTR